MWGTPAFGAQTWGTADLTPVGVAATASIGAIGYFIDNLTQITGVGSTTSIGSLGFLYDGSAVLGSVIAFAEVGPYAAPLTLSGNATIVSRTISKTTGVGSWDTQAYSTNSFTGGASCSFRAGQVNKDVQGGLNTDPTTDASYASIDYSWVGDNAGIANIYESGVWLGTFGAYTTSTVLSIVYDGANVNYYMDGVLKRSVATTANRIFYFDNSLYDVGASITDIHFGSGAQSVVPHSDLDRALTDVAIAGDTGFITANSYKSYAVHIRLNSRI